jgi:Spy/CpxP family protein refolding chaperone
MCAAAAIAVAVQPAAAQRGGGGFGRFRGFSPATIATLDEVQADLKLTDEQKTQIATINEGMRDEMRELFGGGGRPDAGEMEKITQATAGKVDAALDPAQNKRLQEITLQVNGANALNDSAIQQQLHFTAEQTKQFEEARATNREAMQGMRDLPREERREKFAEIQKEADELLMAVLTPEQKTEFEAMKGTPLDVDLSSLRGPGGGGGRGRGRNN